MKSNQEKYSYSNEEIGRLIKDGVDWYIQRLQKEKSEEPDGSDEQYTKLKEYSRELHNENQKLRSEEVV